MEKGEKDVGGGDTGEDGRFVEVVDAVFTHQQNLDGTKDVHGASEGRAQVETETDSSTELWAQRSGNHVVGASSWEKERSIAGVKETSLRNL